MDRDARAAARLRLAAAGTGLSRIMRDSNAGTPVVGSRWTVAQVASHLAFVFEAFTAAAQGDGGRLASGTPQGNDFHARLAAINAADLRERAEKTGDELLAVSLTTFSEGLAGFIAASGELAPVTPLLTPWYGQGVTRSADTLLALALGEVLMHGLDVARTVGARWPIGRLEAGIIVRELLPAMAPLMLNDKGRTAEVSYRIRWWAARSGERAVVLRFVGGAVSAAEADTAERVDCELWMDPVAFALVIYGRAPLWRAILTGRVLAWCRRPWAAFLLPELFSRP